MHGGKAGAGAGAGDDDDDDDASGGDARARAVARAATAASALGGRDKDGLPLELDMDNYDNETGGAWDEAPCADIAVAVVEVCRAARVCVHMPQLHHPPFPFGACVSYVSVLLSVLLPRSGVHA